MTDKGPENQPEQSVYRQKVAYLLCKFVGEQMVLPMTDAFGNPEPLVVPRELALAAGFSKNGRPPSKPDIKKISGLVDQAIIPTLN